MFTVFVVRLLRLVKSGAGTRLLLEAGSSGARDFRAVTVTCSSYAGDFRALGSSSCRRRFPRRARSRDATRCLLAASNHLSLAASHRNFHSLVQSRSVPVASVIRNSVASLNMPMAASPLSGRLAPWWTRALVQKQRPQGIPTGADFENVTLLIPVLRKGQVLVKVLLLSCDPYLRPGMNDWREPMMSEDSPQDVFGGYGVGMVIESCDANFSIGDKVRGRMGWAEHRVVEGAELEKLKDYHEPHSRALNVLSFNGVTAYYGVTEILKPKPGEIVYQHP